MKNKFYLMSGHSSTGELKGIDKDALADSDNGNVLILNLSWDYKGKVETKREFFKTYFSKLGASEVDIIDKETSKWGVKERFEKADLLYLPGGDTNLLIKNIKCRGLTSHLKGFKGVISGNSAGANVLCPEYLSIGHGDTEVVPAMGMLDFWIKCHYREEFDLDLRKLSEERPIFTLKDPSAVVYDGKFKFIGEVWSFYKHQKRKINN